MLTIDLNTTSTTKKRTYRIISTGESIALRYTVSENGLTVWLLLLLWMSRWQIAVSATGQRRMMHRVFFLMRIVEHAGRLAHRRRRQDLEASIRELMTTDTHLSSVAILTLKSRCLIRREVGIVRSSSA